VETRVRYKRGRVMLLCNVSARVSLIIGESVWFGEMAI